MVVILYELPVVTTSWLLSCMKLYELMPERREVMPKI
jgi:hypothetical protein